MVKQKQIVNETEVTKFVFNNISEVVEYIKTNKINDKCIVPYSIWLSEKTTGTKDFEQAMQYLKYGWEHKTKEIKRELEESFKTENNVKTKNIYDVAGFQCSVPRYLQGIPDNMINRKQIKQTEKIITINKDISFSTNYKAKQIQKECVKVLQLVNRLEKQGYRIKLNIVLNVKYIRDNRYKNISIKVCIKQSSQRLNLKQISFPLCNPSMLRRILFAVCERIEELNFKDFYDKQHYGFVERNRVFLKQIYKNEILIPAEVQEKEIIDIEKYRLK